MVSAKVNPRAEGLSRLEESVALSQHEVRDHTPTFKESRPFYFLALYPAADADGVLHRKPFKAQGEIDSHPGVAVLNGLKFKLNIPKDKKWLMNCRNHSHRHQLQFVVADQ